MESISFFVAVDTLSRFVWALPLETKTAAECKDALPQNHGITALKKSQFKDDDDDETDVLSVQVKYSAKTGIDLGGQRSRLRRRIFSFLPRKLHRTVFNT